MGIFNADVIINISPAFFSLQKSGLVRVYLTSVFLLLSVSKCFGDPKPQFDYWLRFLCWDHIGRGWCWTNGRGSGWRKMNQFSDSARESKCSMMHFLVN